MDFIKGLGLVAGAALSTTGPIGMALAAAMNAVLGDVGEEIITPETTTEEVITRFEELSPSVQSLVANAYYDHLAKIQQSKDGVEIARMKQATEQLRIMEESDKNVMVRPKVVMIMTWLMVGIIVVITLAHCYDVIFEDGEWDIVLLGWLSVLPVWVIKTYFNNRSNDKAIKAQVLNNDSVNLPEKVSGKLVNSLLK